jgi:hypothetical protein
MHKSHVCPCVQSRREGKGLRPWLVGVDHKPGWSKAHTPIGGRARPAIIRVGAMEAIGVETVADESATGGDGWQVGSTAWLPDE